MADADAPHPRPQGLTDIGEILAGDLEHGVFKNVIGFVTGFQAPFKTNGSDFKCTIRLTDPSAQFNNVAFHIFTSDPNAFNHVSAGDVMLLMNARVQDRNGLSLLQHRSTEIHVYKRDKIPELPMDASLAHISPAKSSVSKMLDYHRYVTQFYHNSQDSVSLPTLDEFNHNIELSKNTRDKFSLLANVRESRFYDLVVKIVREPYYTADKCTFWVTDFTENPLFYNHAPKGADGPRDGDPYGYLSKYNKHQEDSQWTGPSGKLSMQITAYAPFCDHMRDGDIGVNTWVRLSNVHIRFGSNQNNLEGTIHTDNKYPDKLRVEILETDVDPEDVNVKVKDAIKRKAFLEKAARKAKAVQRDKGQKRKSAADDGGVDANEPQRVVIKKQKQVEKSPVIETTRPLTNKEKRLIKREQEERARLSHVVDIKDAIIEAAQEKARLALEAVGSGRATATDSLCGLNRKIVCEMSTLQLSTVADMTRWHNYTAPLNGSSVQFTLPFVCVQYRADVRVTDFWPRQLEMFATPVTDYDYMSDCDISDLEDEDDDGGFEDGVVDKWKWAFWLRLEDSDPAKKNNKEAMWVVVNNEQAQCLLNLNATNLRSDKKTLTALRQRLSQIWGNLEECKLASDPNPRPPAPILSRTPSGRSWNPATYATGPEIPPPSSPAGPPPNQRAQKVALANLAFTCCVRQYGIKRTEDDPAKMNAGEGKRWERVYGLFGTSLC